MKWRIYVRFFGEKAVWREYDSRAEMRAGLKYWRARSSWRYYPDRKASQ